MWGVDGLIVKGKNQLNVIIVNEYSLEKSVNQAFLIFFESEIKTAELMQREQNKILGDLRAFIFFRLDIPLDFFFLYVVKYALASGWLKYDKNTSPSVGAYFNMP